MKKHPIVVIKLGTSSIVDEKTHQPLLSTLALIVETAVSLRNNGYRVVLVSSGAIGVALQKTGLPRRPKHLPQVQALAAIGQSRLMRLWEELFERLGQTVAQILLTRNDIADRTQYQNAQNTFNELLNMGVIPIVNENDTLAVTEIKFGDNDTLSAITAGMVGADYLFLMTDVDCLYDKNPRKHPDAKPIEVVENILDLTVDVSSAGSALGTGGMSTKIVAARLATAAGVTTIITRSSLPGNIASIVTYIEAKKAATRAARRKDSISSGNQSATIPTPPLHTRFLPSSNRIRDRYFWLLHGLTPHGTLYIDSGAAVALGDKAGLLPVGIVDVSGNFAQQECVRLVEVNKPTKPTTENRTSTPPVAAEARVTNFALHQHNRSQSSANNILASTSDPVPISKSHSSASLSAASDVTAVENGQEIGRALVNYSAVEIKRIAGRRSTEIASVLGYADTEYVAFRENVALSSTTFLRGKEKSAAAPTGKGTERHSYSRPITPTEMVAALHAAGVASEVGSSRSGNLAGSMAGNLDGSSDADSSSWPSTPAPGTPSAGRISLSMGLADYEQG